MPSEVAVRQKDITGLQKRKIRVLQLIHGFTVGGAERVVSSLAMHTDRDRFEVIPCALYSAGPVADEMKAAGIPYHVLGLTRRSVLTGPLFLADLRHIVTILRDMLRAHSIDIVHAHLTRSTMLGLLATRRMAGTRLCATVHSVFFHPQRGRMSPREWLMRAGIRVAFPRVNRIIAVSEEVASAVESYAGVPQDDIALIPNGIDPDRYRCTENREVLRRRLGLPTDRLLVVSVGRLTRPKGYPHLLAALALLAPEDRPLTLIAGDGPDREDLERQATELNLLHDVRFLGSRQDVPDLLGAADVFVLSSLWEGLPLGLLEAMASGLPSVATAVGGVPKVIEHGQSGLLVPAGDELALAESLGQLLRNPLQRQRLGMAARERFERHFSLTRFIAAHERLYEELAMTKQPA